jgi:DNA-binding response OmpR family regulator
VDGSHDVERRLPRLGGARIVVVEDETDVRESVVAVLGHCGAAVRGADSVAAAVAELARGPVDLVVTDIAMPEQDGFALLARVRTADGEHGTYTPVVALTALAGEDDRRRILAAGFDRHVAKPIDPGELAAIVAAMVRRTTSARPRAVATRSA